MINTSLFQREFDKLLANYDAYVNSKTKYTDHDERVKYINSQFNILNVLSKYIALSTSGSKLELQIVTTEEPKTKEQKFANSLVSATTISATLTDYVKRDDVEKMLQDMIEKEREKIRQELISQLPPTAQAAVREDITVKEEVVEGPKKSRTKKKTTENSAISASIPKNIGKKPSKKKETKTLEDNEMVMNNIPYDDYKSFIEAELKTCGCNTSLFSASILKDIPDVLTKDMDAKAFVEACSKKYNKPKQVINSSLTNLLKRADFSKSEYFPLLKSAQENGKVDVNILIKEFIDFVE